MHDSAQMVCWVHLGIQCAVLTQYRTQLGTWVTSNSLNHILLLLKIGQQCVFLPALMGLKSGNSAKVALSWQLSYNKADQGSHAATQQTEESHLSPSPAQVIRVWTLCVVNMSSLTLTFPTVKGQGIRVGEEVRRESCRDALSVRHRQFPGVGESA